MNNAGILRDRVIVNMSEAEFDSVLKVHLRGHFLLTKYAAQYWRGRERSGSSVQASIINTSSAVGVLIGNVGQANYSAAKGGVAALTQTTHLELGRYGVRCNAIAPSARTRLTESLPGYEEQLPLPKKGSTSGIPEISRRS